MTSSLSTLYVDLDGTLIATDLLHEGALRLVRLAPWQTLQLLPWVLLGNKAMLKQRISHLAPLNPAALPYRADVLGWLREQKVLGRRIVLATAADAANARSVAAHLNLFDDVLASNGQDNLKGANKLRAICDHAQGNPFVYVGDHSADLPIWSRAQGAVVVSNSSTLLAQATAATNIERHFAPPHAGLRDVLYGIRLHQWLKNLLIFLPLLPILLQATASMVGALLLGFFAFGFAASSIYVVNDLLDLDSDREHTRKKNRPFAAGRIGVPAALALALGLLAVSITVAVLWLPSIFLVVLGTYVLLTLMYSVWLKRVVLVDVFALATLYTLRILAGAAAIQVPPSFWILGFSLFTFLSLALAKRYVELAASGRGEGIVNKARGYIGSDLNFVLTVGVAAAQVAALVLSLYLNDPVMVKRYNHPYALWLIVPLFLYWLTRIWLKALRGQLHDDPVVFAVRDRTSRLVLMACAGAILLAL